MVVLITQNVLTFYQLYDIINAINTLSGDKHFLLKTLKVTLNLHNTGKNFFLSMGDSF